VSRLQQALDADKFVVTSELNPPKGTDLSGLFSKADALKNAVDAFNLTDSHNARMSVAPIAVAHLLLDRGIEPIMQMTARDRNRIALQADMLAAALLGIHNLVFMGGDPPGVGDHPDAKPVYDMVSVPALRAARCLAAGHDIMGNALKGAPPSFCLGAVVNPGAADLDEEIERMAAKIDAGATFLQSQAVYEAAAYEKFAHRAAQYDVRILAGIIPIKSVRMAHYLNDNVPGIHVPDTLIREIADATDVLETSIDIAARTIREIRPMCQGVHIMAIGWEEYIPLIMERAGLASCALSPAPG
jgi:5,10-methylenetetrahydrofolate reductase